MCGIFGYTGTRTAVPILMDGLRALEYRGYDSAGIYVPDGGAVKAAGAVENLARKVKDLRGGTSGIAHTRWATHGEPTEVNAHPHTGDNGLIWVVHNGIIENYQELKADLEERGHTFITETDTEVLAHLIESYVVLGLPLVGAVAQALRGVRGTYGIAAVNSTDPDTIVVARLGSPIIIGLGDDGNFISSDAAGLLTHTKDVVYLNDGEMAVITKDTYTISTLKGEKQKRIPEKIEWDHEEVQKQGYDHFMLKEIMEIPEVIRNTILGRLIKDRGKVKLGGLESVLPQLREMKHLTIVACGSSAYAGQVGKYLIEEYAKVPVTVEIASEYRYKTILPSENEVLLAISQSGETADTLAAVRKAKELGITTLGIINVVGSSIPRETDAGVYNHAGPEISIASTKAVISQIAVLVLMTIMIGREREMTKEKGVEIITALESLPGAIEKVLRKSKGIKEIAERYAGCRDAMFIGRKAHAAIAREGALKLKEVTYVHADAYPGGELKHGPIAMLDEDFPVIALAPQDDVYEKMLSTMEEIKARKAPIIAVGNEGDKKIPQIATDVIFTPEVHSVVQPIVSIVPLYLFAYYLGVAKGLDVDRPRNLAKSVTVE